MNIRCSFLVLLFGLCLCGCKDSGADGAEVSQKLSETGEIAVEIQQLYKIIGDPYFRFEDKVSRIELYVEDPEYDHQSLATEVTKLKSVQSFQGSLQLVFMHRSNQPESDEPTMWIKYNAKTGEQLKPQDLE